MMAETADTIRPYGPGKFDTIVDSHVYALSLAGCDDECGSVQENGVWYGLFKGPFKLDGSFVDLVPEARRGLTRAERKLLTTCAGCILAEDTQGFVTVEYFDSAFKLARAWEACERDTQVDEESE